MTKNPIIPFLLFVLFSLTTGCFTQNYTLSVLEPADMHLPAGIQKIYFWPFPGAPSSEFENLTLFKAGSDTIVSQIKAGLLHGAYDVMSNSPRFTKVELRQIPGNDISGYKTTLYLEDLKEITRYDSAGTVLVLSRIVAHEYLWSAAITGDYITGDYYLVFNTGWILINPFEQREMKRFDFTDTICIKNGFSIESFPEILYDACYAAGQKTGYRISPYWRDVNRIFYTGPGKDLKDAAAFMQSNRWYNATRIWNDLTDDRNKKAASRASFNMALAFEQNDELDQAYLWVSYADSLQQTTYTKAYKNVLEKRILKKQKLDLQMTGN